MNPTRLPISQLALAATGVPPLTEFMHHVALMHGITGLDNPVSRESFVHTFFDSFYRWRAPYHAPVAPELLAWMNEAVHQCGDLYLTRYLYHLFAHHRPDFRVSEPEGCLALLAWFTFRCAPEWNLPRALMPADLAARLSLPAFDESIPITRLMAAGWRELEPTESPMSANMDNAVTLARSYRMLRALTKNGDPRLVPTFVSAYWQSRTRPEPDTLSTFEDVSARLEGQALQTPDGATVPEQFAWTRRHLVSQNGYLDDGSDVLVGVPGGFNPDVYDPTTSVPDRIVFIYRERGSISGLSKAGRLAAEALTQASVQVIEIDYAFGRNRSAEEHTYNERQLCHAKSALHLVSLNPEYVPECFVWHMDKIADRDYVVGQFFWELSEAAPIHDCGLSLVDEVWVASDYLRQVYSKRVKGPVIVMGQALTLPGQIKPLGRSHFGLPEGSTLFLSVFDALSNVRRKNPVGAVRAFRQAFPAGTEPAGLVLKTRNLVHVQSPLELAEWNEVVETARADPRVIILDHTMSDDELAGLYECTDCFVSLHRSEGFGYGPAEAMSHGKPVIVTNYSGVTDFCRADTAGLVDFRLVHVEPGRYPYMDDRREYLWAEPDIRSAADCLRSLHGDPLLRRKKGEAGRNLIAEQYSLAALRDRYVRRLHELGWMGEGN